MMQNEKQLERPVIKECNGFIEIIDFESKIIFNIDNVSSIYLDNGNYLKIYYFNGGYFELNAKVCDTEYAYKKLSSILFDTKKAEIPLRKLNQFPNQILCGC